MCHFKLLIISTFVLASVGYANAQCEIKVSHEIKAAGSTESLGSIQLKFGMSRSASYEITLFKVSGKPKKVESRTEVSPTELEFKNLEPGDYVIAIERQDGCKVMIGGIEGISVKDERK